MQPHRFNLSLLTKQQRVEYQRGNLTYAPNTHGPGVWVGAINTTEHIISIIALEGRYTYNT